MPRLPKSEMARLKAEVSVQRLAEARGVKFIRKGADLHGRCCFHSDKNPSLVVTPEKNVWNCLGACQTGGSVVDWVMKAEGVSVRHALEILRTYLAGTVPVPTPEAPVVAPKLPPLVRADADDQVLLQKVVGYYHQALQEEPQAAEYLRSRGLGDPELVARFRLGYADRTLGYRLPAGSTQEGRRIRSRLQELGVLRKSGHEHLRGSLVVPLFDVAGNVVQMYGRKIRSDLRRGTALHLYLPGPKRGVLNPEAFVASEELVVCESILDAFTFWAAGIRNVTCAYGAGDLSEDAWECLRAGTVRRVLLAFDRDAAGDAAAEKLATKLQAAGYAVYRVQFPRGMDANEYAQKVTPAAKSLGVVVRQALWMGEGQEPVRELCVGPGATVAPEGAVAGEDEEGRHATKEEGGEVSGARDEGPDRAAGPPSELPSLVAASLPPPEAPEPTSYRVPPTSPASLLERCGEDVLLKLGERTYRVRGLLRNTSPTALKVNLLVRREVWGDAPTGSESAHMETLDLFLARPREAFVKKAAQMLGLEESLLERDVGQLLFALEAALEDERARQAEPTNKAVVLSDAEREEALALLRSPDLLAKILADFEACGVVGEETNKLAGYLAATSRKLERPLAIVVQSNSAAGKSSLMDAVLAFMPEEEQVCYSAMTGQSLFYMSGSDLRHKILAIAEEEGAQRASYALKLLQSEGQLTIASTGKDPVSGRLVTEDYTVKGPVMIFLTTTATDVDEELMNRCLVLAVDEGQVQTQAIQRLQRVGLDLWKRAAQRRKAQISKRHQNAQRLLERVPVHNPYAEQLTFQSHQTRFRRDHMKYLALIETITLLHQYQRERKRAEIHGEEVEYVEVHPSDIQLANRLAHEILGRSVDELPPQTRAFLRQLVALVAKRCGELAMERSEYRFTRREAREWTGLKHNRVHVHLTRLEELEYVLVHAGNRGKSHVYELVYEGEVSEGSPRFSGLFQVHPEEDGSEYDPEDSGDEAEDSARIRSGFAEDSQTIRPPEEDPEKGSSSSSSSLLLEPNQDFPKSARPGAREVSRRPPPTNGTRPPTAPEAS